MARIAEELLLLLLDNAAATPALDKSRRRRLLGAAVLLDLAYACRIRPTTAGEAAGPGRLVLLVGQDPGDPMLLPALNLLSRRPISPARAIARLQRGVEEAMLGQLGRTGQIRCVPLQVQSGTRRLHRDATRDRAWLLTDRTRVARARAAMLSTLFECTPPTPTTAAVISLLYAVDGLGALLSLDDRGWQWVNSRAGDIASGSWISEGTADVDLADVNLAVTAAAVRAALVS
jgi:Golgi phosphoprotein 3 (GPP34)